MLRKKLFKQLFTNKLLSALRKRGNHLLLTSLWPSARFHYFCNVRAPFATVRHSAAGNSAVAQTFAKALSHMYDSPLGIRTYEIAFEPQRCGHSKKALLKGTISAVANFGKILHQRCDLALLLAVALRLTLA